jgi:hypothetical protein
MRSLLRSHPLAAGLLIIFLIMAIKMAMIGKNIYLGRLQIAFFSVSNEHEEQGAKVRNSRLLQA